MKQPAEMYTSVLEAANTIVRTQSDIIISSIPPRIDSVHHQQHVEVMNVVIHDVAMQAGVVFVSNDETFRWAGGIPNDGCLLHDGLLLNNQRTDRLAVNLQLTSEGKNANKAKARRNTQRIDLDIQKPSRED